MVSAIYEMNNILSELNAEFIYESIVIESETDSNQKSNEKKKSLAEKLKKVWKAFCEFVKNAVQNMRKFIRKVAKKIFDNTLLVIPDFEPTMKKLRELIHEIESDNGEEKLDVGEFDIYTSDIFNQTIDAKNQLSRSKKKMMKRQDVVKLYEKYVYEIEGMVKSVDKVVERVFNDLNHSTEPLPKLQQRADNLFRARGYLHGFLNGFIKEIQKAVSINSYENNHPEKEKN